VPRQLHPQAVMAFGQKLNAHLKPQVDDTQHRGGHGIGDGGGVER
jgi:hypothetical protein